jgi:hypothetical protein
MASHRVAVSVLPKLLAIKGLDQLSQIMAEEVFGLLGLFRPSSAPPSVCPHRRPPLLCALAA